MKSTLRMSQKAKISPHYHLLTLKGSEETTRSKVVQLWQPVSWQNRLEFSWEEDSSIWWVIGTPFTVEQKELVCGSWQMWVANSGITITVCSDNFSPLALHSYPATIIPLCKSLLRRLQLWVTFILCIALSWEWGDMNGTGGRGKVARTKGGGCVRRGEWEKGRSGVLGDVAGIESL